MQSCPTCGSPMDDAQHSPKVGAVEIEIGHPKDDGMTPSMAKVADPGASTPEAGPASIDQEALDQIMQIIKATQMAKLPKKPGEPGVV